MICGMLFSSVGRYMSHIARHGPVLYQCTQCGESFSTRLKFNDHQSETSHVGQNILQCKDVTPAENVTEVGISLRSVQCLYNIDNNLFA